MTETGYWVIVASLAATVGACVQYYKASKEKKPNLQGARTLLHVGSAGIVFASFLLVILLVRHDFTNGYVFSYSSTDLPFHFLLSSFYAGQEGSFLFWVLCAALISPFLLKYTARRGIEAPVMTVYVLVQALLMLLLVVKTPFISVWEKFPNISSALPPTEGQGLNPLLQNFWMTLHPPVLFVGFSAMAVPFSIAVAGLWKRKYSLLTEYGFAWVLVAVTTLGIGIMLGAYWAYGVLGWGGYWGWDPVENSSLVPWITGVALIHTLLVGRKSHGLLRTNYALAVASFFLVIYSTFLTRSGILGESSVHSFTDPGMTVYALLVGVLGVLAILGFGLIAARWRSLKPSESDGGVVNRETALSVGVGVLLLSAIIILFGTSLPIFSKSSVEPAFYDSMNLPLAICIGLLMGLSLFVQWKSDLIGDIIRRSLKSLAVSLGVAGVLFWFGVQDWAMLLFAFTSVYALTVNAEFLGRLAKTGLHNVGGKVAHIGMALFFLGVISTGKYSETSHQTLPLHSPQEVLGHTMTYVGYTPLERGRFAFHVDVQKGNEQFRLSPQMFENGQQGIMRNPDIAMFLTRDVYVSPVSLSPGHDSHAHETYVIPKGGSVAIGDATAKFIRFAMDQHVDRAMMSDAGGMTIGSVLEVSNGKSTETITPVAVYKGEGPPEYEPSESRLLGARINLVSMNIGMGGSNPSTITVSVDRPSNHDDHPEALVIEASIKPYINLLWAGTILMLGGFVLAIIKRGKEPA
jgi:cytochrome c-type biogenesis protein CcmF